MEFLDEDARPRFVLQSKPLPQTSATADDSDPQTGSLHRPTLCISLSISIPLLSLSLLYFTSEPLRSVLLWLSISFLIGPFAPLSVTAGDVRVGIGPPIQPDDPNETEPENKKPSRKSGKPSRKSVESGSGSTLISPEPIKINESTEKLNKNEGMSENGLQAEKDWSEGDVDLLRKLLGKHPVGKPGRWEAIADGLKGRHRVESVIKKAKELGEKKTSNEDSFQKFLKDRKQVVDKRENETSAERTETESAWTAGEDLALLNALKAFPKETTMRWEKIAAAVPGKAKAACMKRVTELKRGFRSSKAAASVDS